MTPRTRPLCLGACAIALGFLALLFVGMIGLDESINLAKVLTLPAAIGMAVSANQVTRKQHGCRVSYPVEESTTIYEGTMFFINAAGYAVATTGSGVNRFGGIATQLADNSGGGDGDINVEGEDVGIYELVGSGFSQASVGLDAYATDNYTVAAGYAANGVKIGRIIEYISSTRVRVMLDPQAYLQGSVIALGAGMKMARGQHTTVAASDTIVTGLATVVAVIATLDSDLVDDPSWVSASIGDQAGSPAAGSILIKTWKNTAGNDPTPAAATTFSKKVNWIAIGT
jgi:hypothetical protein